MFNNISANRVKRTKHWGRFPWYFWGVHCFGLNLLDCNASRSQTTVRRHFRSNKIIFWTCLFVYSEQKNKNMFIKFAIRVNCAVSFTVKRGGSKLERSFCSSIITVYVILSSRALTHPVTVATLRVRGINYVR